MTQGGVILTIAITATTYVTAGWVDAVWTGGFVAASFLLWERYRRRTSK